MKYGQIWRNKKNNLQYKVQGIVTDVTNNANTRMVLYSNMAITTLYVREVSEFRRKFQLVEE